MSPPQFAIFLLEKTNQFPGKALIYEGNIQTHNHFLSKRGLFDMTRTRSKVFNGMCELLK